PEAQLIVVLPDEHIPFWENLKARFEVARHTVVSGGAERFDSVKNGLKAVGYDVELVAVQDGVRPLASPTMIRRAVEEAATAGSAIPVVEAVDSYRIVEEERSKIIDRRPLRIVQTPQVFRRALLDEAYEQPFNPLFTDDASVVEAMGVAVHLCAGERSNLKITTPEDLVLARALIAAEEEPAEEN
ncbi:MAG: 2-C-methyl-D-erythritol 4-phosphate cytidylyltransferase, partial [Alistipes sp.]|nr:2-C-methyl-D-erythritol 4-phosphate cytidylyltransferase [Alistipes sp.]